MTSDPEQIRGSIEQTQANLSADIDALAEKVSPQRIVERRVQRTRSAVTTIRDRVMGTTADQASSMTGAAGSATASASDSVASARDSVAGARDSVAGAGDSVAAARDSVSEKASSAADAVGSVPGQARSAARGNPLAAGVIAFGAGWLLSSLLPATQPEQRAAAQVKDLAVEKGRPVAEQLGQAGQEAAQELRESAQQRAQSVKETAADAASTVAGEARTQASGVTGHAEQAGGRVASQVRPDDGR
jgi:hypothetical protein